MTSMLQYLKGFQREGSHTPRNDDSINDRPYIWGWFHKIEMELKDFFHLVTSEHSTSLVFVAMPV